MSLPVSVQVITLNEERNIGDCLDAILVNDPAEVMVIDGGSTDQTVDIAREKGARVLTPGKLGRGASRHLGYHSTDLPYVAMVDAEDRIAPNWLDISLRELQQGNYSALQSQLRVLNPRTFWEHGWNEYFIESIPPKADTIMVGHPAIYVTSDLQSARDDIGHDHEDTQLSVDFQTRGLRQGIGTALSFRVSPDSYRESAEKWLQYGRGYADFVGKHPDRRRSIVNHILVTIPLRRTMTPVMRGRLGQPIFGAAMATAIAAGFLQKSGRDAFVKSAPRLRRSR